MTAFAGLHTFDGRPVDRALLRELAEPAPGNVVDDLGLWVDGSMGLASSIARVTPESASETQPLVDRETGVVVVFDGRLDNRAELGRRLTAHEGPLSSGTDPAYILASYLEWKSGAPVQLLGDFAVAIWDPRERRLLLARDPMGIRPLYYSLHADRLAFASTLEQLLKDPSVSDELDDEMVLSLLYRPQLDWSGNSFYRDPQVLPPGELLEIVDGRVARRRYWQWRTEPPDRPVASPDAAERFREVLFEAVRCRLRSTPPVGLLLSGGMDSGALGCVAGHLLDGRERPPLRTYTYVYDRFATVDERRFSSPIVEQYRLDATYIPGDECWALSELDPWLPVFNEPILGPYDRLSYIGLPVARADGVRAMLTGKGGDVLLLGSPSYLASWLATGRWRELARQLRAKAPRSRHPSFAYQLAAWAILPLLPPSFQGLAKRLRFGSTEALDWMPALVRERSRAERPRPAWGPNAWWHELRREIHAISRSPHQPYYDRLMRLFGLELRHPFLDARIVDFVLSTPRDAFNRDGISRLIVREALGDLMPPVVRERMDKGDAAPLFHHGLREQRSGYVRELTRDSELERRGYVLPGPWKRSVESYLAGESDVHLWPTIAVELWLRHREGRLPPLE